MSQAAGLPWWQVLAVPTVGGLLIGLLCRGHVLLMGVPGLGKTLMARTLARTLDMKFRRVQFTPDLMPSDITGTDIIQEDAQTGQRQMVLSVSGNRQGRQSARCRATDDRGQ